MRPAAEARSSGVSGVNFFETKVGGGSYGGALGLEGPPEQG